MKTEFKYGFPVFFTFFLVVFALFTYALLSNILSDQPAYVPFVAVFSVDGMCFVYFYTDHYYRKENGETRFLTKEAHDVVKKMYIICFVISALCSFMFNVLWLHHFNWSDINPVFENIAEWIAPIVFTLHALVFYRIYHLEHLASLSLMQHPVINRTRIVEAKPAKKVIAAPVREAEELDPYISDYQEEIEEEDNSKKKSEPVLINGGGGEDRDGEEIDEYDWATRAEKETEVILVPGKNNHAQNCKCVGCRPDLHRRSARRGRPPTRNL